MDVSNPTQPIWKNNYEYSQAKAASSVFFSSSNIIGKKI